MSLQYGLNQPLRFYREISSQNRFRRGADVNGFKLYCPADRVLPFQIIQDASEAVISSMQYVNVETGATTDVMGALASGQLRTYTLGDARYFVHFGSVDASLTMPQGQYFVKLSNGSQNWFSEVVTLQDFNYDLLGQECILTRIEYWATCDIDGIFYRTEAVGDEQYKNVAYLDLETGRPEYLYDEDGDEAGDGVFEASFRRAEKQYLLQGAFPEFFLDAMALLPLHIDPRGIRGAVEIYTHLGYGGAIDKVAIDAPWQGTDGVWAIGDIAFVMESIVRTNCCDAEGIAVGDIGVGSIRTMCLDSPLEAVAFLFEGTANYINRQYTDSVSGDQVDIVDGDLVVTAPDIFSKHIKVYDANLDDYVDPAPLHVVGTGYVNLNDFKGSAPAFPWYFKTSVTDELSQRPLLTSDSLVAGNAHHLTGETWDDCTVEVAVYDGSNETVVSTLSGATFNSVGATYVAPTWASGVRIYCEGPSGCDLGKSRNLLIEGATARGISISAVGDDFVVD